MDKTETTIRRVFRRLGGANEPQKVPAIIDEWEALTGEHISPRKWRRIKDEFNQKFRDKESDSYICGFPTGYVLTKNDDLIRHDMAIKRRQALAVLARYSDAKQALALQNNYRFDFAEIAAKKGAEGSKR